MHDQIIPLRGPERVRCRPAVVFGSADAKGVENAIEMLLRRLIPGGCTELSVTVQPDNRVEIQDNGKGLYLDNWQALFDEIYAASPWEEAGSIFDAPADPTAPVDSLELCAVQYAAAWMEVSVVREGLLQTLTFEKGKNIRPLSKAPTDAPTGTRIRFLPDATVFSDITVDVPALSRYLQSLALQVPGLQTACNGQVYRYSRGIADYLQGSPVYTAEGSARGRERYNRPDYAGQVTLGLCFVKDGGFAECYHNLQPLPLGGTHLDAVLQSIGSHLSWSLELPVTPDFLQQHLQLVMVTTADFTHWADTRQTAIGYIFLRDLAVDTLESDFAHFLRVNASALSVLLH